jgi:uncharacterized DUF497 family protein
MDLLGRVIILVYTWQGDRVRIISPRKATAREQRSYEEEHEA